MAKTTAYDIVEQSNPDFLENLRIFEKNQLKDIKGDDGKVEGEEMVAEGGGGDTF